MGSVNDHILKKKQDRALFESNPVEYIIVKQELGEELTPREKDFMYGCFAHECIYMGGGELGVKDNQQFTPTD